MSKGSQVSEAAPPELKHNQVGLLGVLIPGMAVMSPAGSLLFGVAVLASIAGASVPLIFVIAMLAILATGHSLAKFSERWPSSGSFVTFISRTLGARYGLFVATGVLIGLIVAYAGVYVFLGDYIAAEFLHNTAAPWPTLCSIAFVAVIMIPVVRGLELSLELSLALLAIEIAVIVIITAAVLLSGGADGVSLEPFKLPSGGLEPIALGFATAIFLFGGFEQSVPLAEESKNPRKNVPRALYISIVVVGVIFIVSSWALVLGFESPAALAESADPLHDAAEQYVSWLAPVTRWVILSSFLAFAISVNTAFARVIFNTARAGLFPGPLSKLTRWKTPANAAAMFAGVALALGLFAKLFYTDEAIAAIYSTAGTLALILMYASVNIALVVLWFKDRARGQARSVISMVVVPIVGAAVLLIPYYYDLKPGQEYPANKVPIYFAGILVLSLLYVLGVRRFRRDKLDSAGSVIAGEEDPLEEVVAATAAESKPTLEV